MAYNKNPPLNEEMKMYIKDNNHKKPKVLAQELNIEVRLIRWFLWSTKKKETLFDFDCCPITGFKHTY